MDNPFKKRQEQRNKILEGKDEIIKKKEIAELDKMFEIQDTKERFDYAAKILAEHGGLESSIAINHPYWKLRP
jgi:hypothetical protein